MFDVEANECVAKIMIKNGGVIMLNLRATFWDKIRLFISSHLPINRL